MRSVNLQWNLNFFDVQKWFQACHKPSNYCFCILLFLWLNFKFCLLQIAFFVKLNCNFARWLRSAVTFANSQNGMKKIHTQQMMLQQPAVWASCGAGAAQGCKPWRAANGAPFPFDIDGAGGPNPLLRASACNDSINRFAACRSASRSSAVCLLRRRVELG